MARRAMLALLVGFAASPAFAGGDPTGAYAGDMTCETTTDTGVARDRFEARLDLDLGSDGNAYAVWKTTLMAFRLSVLTPPGESFSRVVGPACTFSAERGGGLLLAEARVDEASGAASLKGEIRVLGVGAGPHSSLRCRFAMRRTSTQFRGPLLGCS